MEKLEYGKHFLNWKVKVYKHPGSSFILCQSKYNNYECIYKIREDGLLADGIYKFKGYEGDTQIGSKYFCRSGRKEEREYSLGRNNESGNIHHYRESEEGDYLRYFFNPETLVWKIDNDI